MPDNDADCLIVGGGHNGLVAAWYLARAGLKVLVLERRPIVGGGAVTEEPFPGYRIGTCAYIAHMLQPKVIHDLALRDHGLHIYPLDPAALFPFPDGAHFRMWHSAQRTAEEIAPLSAAAAKAYPAWIRFWERAGALLLRYFLREPPTLAQIAADVAGTDDAALLETLLTVPLRDLAESTFQDPRLAAAAVGTGDFGQIDAPGSALTQAYFKTNLLTPDRDYGIVRGGMGGITQAMAAAATAAGATIRTEAPVQRILVRDGRACGVVLASGETLTAPDVLSNADPKTTFLRLVDPAALPSDFLAAVARLKTRSASLKVHAVLKRLPDFSRFLRPDDDQSRLAMIRIMPSLDAIEASWRDAMAGIPTRHPLMQLQIPTVIDPTLAPPGAHVLSAWVTYQPARLREGTWAARGREVGERLLDAIAGYAPDIRDCVEDWLLISPEEIESRVGMTDGNIRHLDILPHQMLAARPLPGWSGYRTPVTGLYLCGAGTHPGGEVTGAPGHNAAHALLRDHRGAA